VDGLLSGIATENEYAALQEQSYAANQQDAIKLTQGSLHVTIGYPSTTPPVNWRMNDAKTPLRHSRSSDETELADSKPTFTKLVPGPIDSPGPPNTTQEGVAVRQMEARMTTKFETQMNAMMYNVMQVHLDKAAKKIQENSAATHSELAPPGQRPARYHAVNRGPGLGVYRSPKKAKRAAKMRTRAPPAEIQRFPTEYEAWEWIDEASWSTSSSREEESVDRIGVLPPQKGASSLLNLHTATHRQAKATRSSAWK
jgi:hypothetical protein